MGIKHLNSFLRTKCSNSIQRIHLKELAGKKIAVDISIYIYKFLEDKALIENIYLMLATFRYYDIIPVFVFDGKPPAEKKALLDERRLKKREARIEYYKLKDELNNDTMITFQEKQELEVELISLQKQCIYITSEQIASVKELIVVYGMNYIEASGEADVLCASLAIDKTVWGCLSEDMDLFVYGCPYVLRYLSLLNHSVVLYQYESILKELGITDKEFREICVLSGTDYSEQDPSANLSQSLQLFKKYYKDMKNLQTDDKIEFYHWIQKTNSLSIMDIDTLKKIYSMFSLTNILHTNENENDNLVIKNNPIQQDALKVILQKDGFIFGK